MAVYTMSDLMNLFCFYEKLVYDLCATTLIFHLEYSSNAFGL